MRSSPCLAWIAALAPLSSAIQLVERNGPPSVLSLETTRRSLGSAATRDQLRRLRKRGSVQVTLDNESTLYFANVSIGTPSQTLRLDLDTGSSDIWANSKSSQLCQKYSNQCAVSGTYNANQSSTYKYTNSNFLIKYADGSYARGDYATDTLQFGGQSITNVPFGIGYDSTSSQGILGVGYAINEASISTSGKTYQNLPQILVAEKIINSNAYSLWLNDLSANTGSILFGGVDTDKYHGDLQTLPIIKEAGDYREFIVALTSLTVAGQKVFDNSPIPVLLDSGSSLTYLPDQYAQSIFTIVNAQYSSSAGAAVVPCSLMNSDKTFDFSFSGLTIQVPMNELVIVDGVRNRQQVCILGISAAGDSTAVLGDTFLRSAYVVYDLSNNQISLGQTNFNATSSTVREIASGTSGVPGAKLVANAVSTLSVATGGARNGGQPGVTAIGSIAAAATPTMMPLGRIAAAAAAGLALAL